MALYKSLINVGIYTTAFLVVSFTLNILLTLLIAGRMWYHRYEARRNFGSSYGHQYSAISTIFIESAALYGINCVLVLATFIPMHPIHQIWMAIVPSVQVCHDTYDYS